MSRVIIKMDPTQFLNDLRESAAKGLTAGAAVLADEMQRNFGTEGGGVIGKTKKGRNVYAPAPAGSFPGIRTGNLRRSVVFKPAKAKDLVSAAGCAAGKVDRYGYRLEYGDDRIRMAARPWAMRSYNRAKPRIWKTIIDTTKLELINRTVNKPGGTRGVA